MSRENYIQFLLCLYRLNWFSEDFWEKILDSRKKFLKWFNSYYSFEEIETKKDLKEKIKKLYNEKILDQTLNYMSFDEWFEIQYKELIFSDVREKLEKNGI